MSLASDLYPIRPEPILGRAFEPASARQNKPGVEFEGLDLLRSLWRSGNRRRIVLLGAGIFAVLIANMAGQVRLNHWQGAFFDALNRRDLAGLVSQLITFGGIVGVLLTLCGRTDVDARDAEGAAARVADPAICSTNGWRPAAPIVWGSPARSASIPISASNRTHVA